MKKYLYVILLSAPFSFSTQTAGAWNVNVTQPGPQASDPTVRPDGKSGIPSVRYSLKPRAEWQGDSLRVRFSGGIAGRFKGPVSLHLIPVYVSGADTIRYPELACFTPSGAKYHIRREVLAERKTAGQMRILYRNSHGNFEYREAVAVPPSTNGTLYLQQVMRTCCDSRLLSSETVAVPERAAAIADTLRTTVPGVLPLPVAAVSVPLSEPNVTFVAPKAEAVKERTATATVRITYPVNQWTVCPGFGENESELHRIDRLLAPVAVDTATYRILSVSITGYASPEDTWEHNMTLSGKRAGGMRDYLRERYALPSERITAEGRGEDWEGLRRAVAESDMDGREEVLAIIDTCDLFTGREKALMDLRDGEVYRYLLRNLYPPLRRIQIRIDYRVRAFGADEAGELIGSRPQDLSLREMYDVARAENDERTILRQRGEYGRDHTGKGDQFPFEIFRVVMIAAHQEQAAIVLL